LYEAREVDELEFFHVMFDSHDALYVEDAPCESLLTGHEAASLPDPPGWRRSRPLPVPTCAPLAFNGGRSELKSRLRSALSPWFDCRRRVDIVRDALDRRTGLAAREADAAAGSRYSGL
jgi:hypothetical protein